jgi:hypothetical protein
MKEDTGRQRVGGGPLRRSEGVIHLQMTDSLPTRRKKKKMQDYIYEAQISVLVTGIDDWVWAAYCFVDVYFKDAERVHLYSDPRLGMEGMDPHSCGKHRSNPPTWIPREYFLRTFQARIEQVKDEWNNSVSRLIQQIEPYARLQNPSLKLCC